MALRRGQGATCALSPAAYQVLGSACAAASVVLLASLFTPAGRARWSELAKNLLPSNPMARRALAWLPLITVARGLESSFGLPLLNWVYIAIAAGSIQSAIALAAANAPPRAPAAPSEAAAPAPAPAGGDGLGLNSLARGLFAQRFPDLAAQPLLATSPAALAGGAQGQLYVTGSQLALHGTWGRNSRVVPLAEVREATLVPAGPSERMATLSLLLADGEVVELAALVAMGGAEALAAAHDAWRLQQ